MDPRVLTEYDPEDEDPDIEYIGIHIVEEDCDCDCEDCFYGDHELCDYCHLIGEED